MKHMMMEDYKRLNNNTVLFGRSDSEKEKLTKYEILKSLDERKHVIVVDFNDNYTEFCRLLGGRIYEIRDGLEMNPLEIFNFETSSEEDEGCPGLASKLFQVRNILTTLLGFTKEEEKEIWKPLVNLYEKKGIVERMKEKPREFPSLEELAEAYPKKREEILQFVPHFSSKKSTYQHEQYSYRRLTVLSFKGVDASILEGVVQTYLNYYAYYLWSKGIEYRLFIDDVAPFVKSESFMGAVQRLVFNARHHNISGVQVNSSVFKYFYEHGGRRVLSFSDTQVILSLEESDIDSFCNNWFVEDKKQYQYLTKQSIRGVLMVVGGYEQERLIDCELAEVDEMERYLNKRKEIDNLKTLKGKVTRKYFKFKNIFNKEYGYLIDGYDVTYFLQNNELDEKEIKIEVFEKSKGRKRRKHGKKNMKPKRRMRNKNKS